ncbi:hypothetical protein AGMMS50268_14010 [Spirochaetia bacterium]|nr:hypothetical protein AGMMS50268_14010 [Spirochaetia bacterium]
MKKRILGIIAIGAAIMVGLSGCNTLQTIEVSTAPARTVYGQGQELDRSGLVVMGHFKKDSREVTNESQVSGYDPGKPGEQTVTVTVKKQSATFKVTVVPVEKLSISQPPAKTVYMQGDDFDPTGLSVLVDFEKGAVPSETVISNRLTVSGYSKNKSGAQSITVEYFGKRTSFEVKIAALVGIAVGAPPNNTEYFTGEDLDLSGLIVNGTWEGNRQRTIQVTLENLSSFDKNRAGKQDVFITYSGKTTSFPVTFVGMQSILITRPPAKLNYENGERLDLADLTVQGTRTGATSIEMVDVSRLKISGYDRFKAGNQTVTVTIGGRSATFRVTVEQSPFVGTWLASRTTGAGTYPVTLTMSEDSWAVSWPTIDGVIKGYEYGGTYTRDSDTGNGKHATLSQGYVYTEAPTDAQILSATELQLTGNNGWFRNPGETYTRR